MKIFINSHAARSLTLFLYMLRRFNRYENLLWLHCEPAKKCSFFANNANTDLLSPKYSTRWRQNLTFYVFFSMEQRKVEWEMRMDINPTRYMYSHPSRFLFGEQKPPKSGIYSLSMCMFVLKAQIKWKIYKHTHTYAHKSMSCFFDRKISFGFLFVKNDIVQLTIYIHIDTYLHNIQKKCQSLWREEKHLQSSHQIELSDSNIQLLHIIFHIEYKCINHHHIQIHIYE